MSSHRFPLKPVLRLTRAWNILIIVIAQYAAAWFLLDPSVVATTKLFLLSLSTGLIAAAGYIINDYFDIKIDLINRPDRVVVGTTMSRRSAIFLHVVLSLAGVLAGWAVNWKVAGLNIASALLLWLYSARLKRGPFFGNLSIALLTFASVVVIYLAFPSKDPLIWFYAGFAFAMTMVREAVKDMEDVKGDKTFGCETLPIIWGLYKTKMYTAGWIAILLTFIFVVHRFFYPLPVLYFLPLVFLPLGIFSFRLVRADTVKEFNELSLLSKIILMLGIVSMAAI
ncbi:MAG: geranylgeranylglycerol-phosphate geranylgeranyltransferase [Bacteroidetes bacterium]|nr:geranylgeranylglycerol-phosphate geranylgeranyltransferase [Bacteroidota bacterium]